MDSDARFLWLGNHPAMDLLNTEPIVDGEHVELLPDVDALRSWSRLAGVVGDEESFELSARAASRALQFVRRLRAAVRRALEPETRGVDAVQELNDVLRDAPGTLHVDGAPAIVSLAASRPADQLCLDVAAAAVDIFRHDRRRVRTCVSPTCVLMFLDVSKSGRRRWCDMATCGNRAKAAAHHARKRDRVVNAR